MLAVIFSVTFCLCFYLQRICKIDYFLSFFAKILLGVSAVMGLVTVFAWGVDFPYLDSWADIYLYRAPLQFTSFMLSTGGHVIILPRLVLYLLGNLTAWNTIYFLAFQWLMSVLLALGVTWFLRKSTGSLSLSPLILLTIGLAVSPNTVNFYLDNRLQSHIMCFPLFFFAVFLFGRSKWWLRNLAAPAVCFLATFTSGWGILIWFAFAPAILISALQKRRFFSVIVWSGFAVISFLIFLNLFTSGYGKSEFITLRAVALGLIDFVLMVGVLFFNAPLNGGANLVNVGILIMTGCVLCGLQCFVIFRTIKNIGALAWLTNTIGITTIYCVFAGLMATIGRAEFYPFSGLGMRYVNVAIVFVAVLIAHCLVLARARSIDAEIMSLIKIGLVSIIIASYPVASFYAFKKASEFHRDAASAVRCVRSENPYEDFSCYERVYSDIDLPERQQSFVMAIDYMKKHHLSAFRYSKNINLQSI